MLRRKEDYSMIEVEMILNYFPHNIWRNEAGLARLSQGFYYPMIQMVKENISKVDKRAFLSLFQGLTLAGDKVFRPELLNIVLNSYVQRLKPVLQPDEAQKAQRFTVGDVMAFMELFVQYIRSSEPEITE